METREGRRAPEDRRWETIDEMDSGRNGFGLMTERNITGEEKSTGLVSNVTMFVFRNTILFSSIRARGAVVNTKRRI